MISQLTGGDAGKAHKNLTVRCGDGALLSSPDELANYFNNFFAKAPHIIRERIPHVNGATSHT